MPWENAVEQIFPFSSRFPTAGDFGQPYSPTHGITTDRHGDQLEITVDAGGGSDIELFLPLRQGIVGTSAVAHAPGGEDGYLMLLLAPAMTEDGPVVPRDLSLVVDVSGSMSGANSIRPRPPCGRPWVL